MRIGPMTFDEFAGRVRELRGSAPPGALLGGVLAAAALARLSGGEHLSAICETPSCLPDAVQALCGLSAGGGRLRVLSLGRFAVALYDRETGRGVRASVNLKALEQCPRLRAWLLGEGDGDQKTDSAAITEEIEAAGESLATCREVSIRPRLLSRWRRGRVSLCPVCGEPYPGEDGSVCRGCMGDAPYESDCPTPAPLAAPAAPRAVPLREALGHRALHDMTRIVPGESKGPAVRRGEVITAGDLCRLQTMGRMNVFVEEAAPAPDLVHEDEAATAFARLMAGDGVAFALPPREGKVNLKAARSGLLLVSEGRLERFNLVPGVMCASRHAFSVVKEGATIAGTRAIPLFLPRPAFLQALAVLDEEPLFRVAALAPMKVGVLVTGTEVFQGLIEDRFIPIIRAKVEHFGCKVVKAAIAPDDRAVIARSVGEMLAAGAELIVTTAGLSVDPDDVTRAGLTDAGATELLYGAPLLPGAMTLLARIGAARVVGVPACGLFFRTTAFDVLLPRLLAGQDITRHDLAALGHGGLCHECEACLYPACPFGK